MIAMPQAQVEDAAGLLLQALDERRSIPPLTGEGALGLPDAYRISRAVAARRIARGETPVGRKIGFTNRGIWDEYGVHQPIHGPVYDTTLFDAAAVAAGFAIGHLVEPRIEPEIVLGLATAPDPAMDERALMDCIGWIAHGFEIVQSLFPAWRFAAPDCVAAFGLHGALLCGPKRTIAPDERAAVLAALGSFSLRLSCDGALRDTGHGRNVLDGPVSALRHLVRALADDPEAAPLQAGEIVTTGTLTRAFPIGPGERWTTALDGIDLPGLDVRFTQADSPPG
jgi:2-oxo-3-hexenedioate decarboxylase